MADTKRKLVIVESPTKARTLTGVLGAFGKAVTILILPFYLLLESTSLRNGFLRVLPEDSRKRADRIMRAVTIKVGAWLGGLPIAHLGDYTWMWHADIALALLAAVFNLPISEARVVRSPTLRTA